MTPIGSAGFTIFDFGLSSVGLSPGLLIPLSTFGLNLITPFGSAGVKILVFGLSSVGFSPGLVIPFATFGLKLIPFISDPNSFITF